jgi:transposase-like protein
MAAIMFQEFDSLFSMMQVFSGEKKCIDHFRAVRWPDGVTCPHCGSVKIYDLSNGTHKCGKKECALKFSVRYDTIFEDSKISLQKWFMAIYLVTSDKKGISSCQLAREIKITQKSAWHMLHRIRAVIEGDRSEPMSGVVEKAPKVAARPRQFEDEAMKRATNVTSVGHVVSEDADFVMLAPHISTPGEGSRRQLAGHIAIPRR